MSELTRYKVIVLGNVAVGKTSLSHRQCRMPFRPEHRASVGVLKMQTNASVNGQDVHLEIWDTAGQEQYKSLVPMYLRGASVCILVCAVNDPNSISGLDQWLAQVQGFDGSIPFIVGVNKTDLVDDPSVLEDVRRQLSPKYPEVYFCSAQRGDGIEEVFGGAAAKCLSSHRPAMPTQAQRFEEPPPPSSDCC
jgi:Rab family protein